MTYLGNFPSVQLNVQRLATGWLTGDEEEEARAWIRKTRTKNRIRNDYTV